MCIGQYSLATPKDKLYIWYIVYFLIYDYNYRVNHAIERNAFLESELDEKNELQCLVQRLKVSV